jgi:hypothetical protein
VRVDQASIVKLHCRPTNALEVHHLHALMPGNKQVPGGKDGISSAPFHSSLQGLNIHLFALHSTITSRKCVHSY